MERFANRQIGGKVLLVAILLLWGPILAANAADHYVYPSATGTGTGASCTNAYTGFGTGTGKINPASMVRGDTYWLLAGNFGAPNFNTAASGTTVITVEAATAASHGAATDCTGLYGQAVFGADVAITSSYWVINGNGWAGSSCTGLDACNIDAAYNIYFHNTTDTQGDAISVGPGTNFTLEYLDMSGPHTLSQWSSNTGSGTNYGDDILVTPGGANPTNNLYVGYSYLHDAGVDIVGSNNQTSSTGTNGSGHTYEHDVLARDWYTCTSSTACNHSQAMSECVTNFTVRYNVFLDIVQDGVIDVNVSNTCPIGNWSIYGNTIEWDNNIPPVRQANVGGFLGFYGQTIASGMYVDVYNNTYVNVGGTQGGGANVQASMVCYSSGVGSKNSGTINIENNLFYQTGDSNGAGTASDVGCGTIDGTYTADYNQGYCPTSGCTNGAGYSPSGAHDVQSNTGNPFVNFDGVSNFNVALVANTAAGVAPTNWSTLPSGCTSGVNCMNVDGLGVTSTANGTWDRGAFQFSAGSASLPDPATNLQLISVQ